MKTNKLLKFISVIAFLAFFIYACTDTEDAPTPNSGSGGSSDTVTITANEFTTNLDENPTTSTVIGTVSATASDGSTLTYSLSNENVVGALAIDANSGELTVANASAFDFERNTSITASYTASNGTDEATANITITVNDLDDSDFIFKWKVGANELVQINNTFVSSGFTVDWGDGTVTDPAGGFFGYNHTYATAGEYTVTISGDNFHQLQGSVAKITSVEQWGSTVWKNMDNMFTGATDLVFNARDIPNTSQVTSMLSMFKDATNFNSDISKWDVSNVENMNFMFNNATTFNQDISKWNVGKVTTMISMFQEADAFNQDIGDWDVSSLTKMTSMFAQNDVFNQDISKWNVSKVDAFSGVFDGAKAFNQNINDWDVSSGTNFARMFAFNDTFNQPLNNWNVSNATNFFGMFLNATAFNQPLSAWGTKTGKVTSMNSMFSGATDFDQDLSGWNVSGITDINQGCFNFGKDSGMSASDFPAFTCITQ